MTFRITHIFPPVWKAVLLGNGTEEFIQLICMNRRLKAVEQKQELPEEKRKVSCTETVVCAHMSAFGLQEENLYPQTVRLL